MPITRYIQDDYNANVAIAKPYLPKGCRFIELGEALPYGVTFVYGGGRFEKNDCWAGVKMTKGGIPCFIEGVKKPARAPKLADRVAELEKEVKDLRAKMKALKEGIRKAVG